MEQRVGRRFLQALRTAIHPAARQAQRKVVGADYYSVLAAAGVYGAHRARPWPVDRAVLEAFERTIWVFKSVQAITGHAAALPFKLKQGEDELDDHPLMRVLNRRANPLETGPQFRKRLGAQILLSKKGAFVEVTTARNGDVLRMDLLPPGRTTPIPEDRDNPESLIKYFEVARVSGGVRRLEPEQVRWFRDPHPLDPYSGITPLEAAGMSVELDVFSRWYNVQFLRNDARPGGVLAVDGDMSDGDMRTISETFKSGPGGAGQFQVITGKVSYIDLATRPRDMQYGTTAKTAKEEILAAFGVGESVIGNAAGRTFDNAAQELYNFWTITMPPFLDIFVTGLDGDSDDELTGFFDTDGVEALQRAKLARREEARTEVEAGLRSIDEYREEAGLPPLGTPQSRALYIPAGKTPIPSSEEDAIAMGLGPADHQPALAGGEAEGNTPEEGAVPEEAPGQLEGAPQPRAIEAAPTAVTPVQDDLLAGIKTRLHLVTSSPLEVKETPGLDSDPPDGGEVESAPDPAVMAHLEAVLAATLNAASSRLLARTAARLTSPKARKHTRHWRPDVAVKADTRVGQQALDAPQVVETQRWQEEMEAAAAAVVASAAAVAATQLYSDLGVSAPVDLATRVLGDVVGDVVALVGASAASQALRLVTLIAEADQEGRDLQDIIDLVSGHSATLAKWAAGVAVQASTATILGARDAAARDAADSGQWDIVRQWISRRDERVRPTHRKADGQTQDLGSPFAVGTALLRFPGDPLGPPGEVRNCRCRLLHRARSTGRFVATPPGQVTRRAG
jgi:HK97 family phage portal protein